MTERLITHTEENIFPLPEDEEPKIIYRQLLPHDRILCQGDECYWADIVNVKEPHEILMWYGNEASTEKQEIAISPEFKTVEAFVIYVVALNMHMRKNRRKKSEVRSVQNGQ